MDSGSVSSVYPSSQHPLHNRQKSEAFYFIDNIGMFKNICEQSCYFIVSLTERIGIDAAAALLRRGRLAGPGRAALSPTLSGTEEKTERRQLSLHDFSSFYFSTALFTCPKCLQSDSNPQ